ncbi:MAG: hypothetical protein K0Q83_2743 [Deltaproteobacteria bacterium]|jgi:hypothetical protein|nr:hypothetical protein [Deltaproteobacteria bacterium]
MVSVLGMNTFGNVISIPLFSIIRRSTLWEHLSARKSQILNS